MKLQMLEATYHIKNIEQHTHKEHKEIFKKQKKNEINEISRATKI